MDNNTPTGDPPDEEIILMAACCAYVEMGTSIVPTDAWWRLYNRIRNRVSTWECGEVFIKLVANGQLTLANVRLHTQTRTRFIPTGAALERYRTLTADGTVPPYLRTKRTAR